MNFIKIQKRVIQN